LEIEDSKILFGLNFALLWIGPNSLSA
jgi:hypothetical protein